MIDAVPRGLGGLIGVLLGVGVVLATPLLDKSGGVMSHFVATLTIAPIWSPSGSAWPSASSPAARTAWRKSRLNPIEAVRHE